MNRTETSDPTPLASNAATAALPGWVLAGLSVMVLALFALAWWIAGAAGRPDLQVPALITGVIVAAASLAGLVPLVLTRKADPLTSAVTGRLGHMVVRLMLTAGGLIFYLLTLPEAVRFDAGLVALGWYLLGWACEWFFILRQLPRAAT